ncbi:MAG: Holliday junction ATP-dependent DNA helicase RuvA [Chloroflexi bacterium]|nr:Holliday junction ATP-dependent DNA helicase RuvA [Chloroflexota bacterium]
MLVGVRGALEAVGSDWVNVQVGGVTLQVSVPASSVAGLGSVGEQVRLHTILRIQNEQPVLYGFVEAGSVELFGALTGVSGIGPRSAMSILSELGEDGFRQAVASEDVVALARAQGVGRRTAQRVVLELRGKLPDADAGSPVLVAAAGTDAEAIEALTALGMTLADARQVVAGLELPADAAVEDKVRQALMAIGGG